MLIDITEKCTMGCTHCISNCTEFGRDMLPETYAKIMRVVANNKIHGIVLSGGEMFESAYIRDILDITKDIFNSNAMINEPVSITTNGRLLSSDLELYSYFVNFLENIRQKKRVLIQVTDDKRFYPTQLDKKQIYRLQKLGAIIEEVPTNQSDKNKCLYPQGRALENFDENWWNTKAPKCVNIRLLLAQKPIRTFSELCNQLFVLGFLCTPSVGVDGSIRIGESMLCPVVSNIAKTDEEIINDIIKCKCQACQIPIGLLKANNPLAYGMVFREGI